MRHFLPFTLMLLALGGCHHENTMQFANTNNNQSMIAQSNTPQNSAQQALLDAEATQKSEKDACLDKLQEHKSATKLEKCFNKATIKFCKAIKFPYMDLIYSKNAYMLKIADQIDKGELPASAIDDAEAEYMAKITEIVRERENEENKIKIAKIQAATAYMQTLSPLPSSSPPTPAYYQAPITQSYDWQQQQQYQQQQMQGWQQQQQLQQIQLQQQEMQQQMDRQQQMQRYQNSMQSMGLQPLYR